MSAPPQHYRDHAALVASAIRLPLPGAEPDAEPHLPRVHLTVGPVDDIADPDVSTRLWRSKAGRVVVDLEGVGRAAIDDGRSIVVDDQHGVAAEPLGQIVASTVLTTAAVLRGTTVIHAIVLRVGGRSIAIAAPSGSGKSTLGLALERRGACVHADDACHIDDRDASMVATRGWSPLRLLPDAARALGTDPDTLPAMPGPPWKKVYEPATREAPSSHRLDALFVLSRGDVEKPTTEPLGRAQAVPAIARSLYRRSLISRLQGATTLFERAARVAAAVPVAHLTVPDDLRVLDRTADAVFDLVWTG